MPTIGRTRQFGDYATATDPLQRALSVAGDLERWGRPTYPERPPSLDLGVLADVFARRAQGMGHTSTREQQLLTLLGAWRLAVWKAEAEASSRLRVLLSAIQALEFRGRPAGELRAFVAESYGRKVPERVFDSTLGRIAEAIAADRTLLPDWLQRGRPPQGRPAPSPRKRQRHQMTIGEAYGEAYGDD